VTSWLGNNNRNLALSSPSLRPSSVASSSRLSLCVHHASSHLQPLSLLHSFAMPMIGNLHISLRRRYAVPMSTTLRSATLLFAPLLPRCHARIPLRHARIPLVVSRPSSTKPSSSTLVVSGELERFPLGFSDFGNIRQLPGLAYFDKTEYIPVLERGSVVQLVCRPRRFGKSLNVSMLRYFHGFQFRNEYDQLFKVCLSATFACIHHLC
jgi:hypothetical protein